MFDGRAVVGEIEEIAILALFVIFAVGGLWGAGGCWVELYPSMDTETKPYLKYRKYDGVGIVYRNRKKGSMSVLY